jgi:L-seryl-tRNA(Ser) seleniumtransferase
MTNVRDYEEAISPRTAALLRVHSSNFKIMGFTGSVALEELVELGNRFGLIVLDDLGSGCLLDTTQFGLDPEPTVQQSMSLGASLAFFSGDKLLGGPQAGVIVGKRHLVDKLSKHPLARAVRTDKIRLAGLAVTLIQYIKGEALAKIPIWRMISAPLDEMEKRAAAWAQVLGDPARVIEGESMVGGGSLPGGTLPTRLVAIGKEGKKRGENTAQVLARILRTQEPPLVARLSGNVLLLDPRSVPPEEDAAAIQSLRSAVASLKRN